MTKNFPPLPLCTMVIGADQLEKDAVNHLCIKMSVYFILYPFIVLHGNVVGSLQVRF